MTSFDAEYSSKQFGLPRSAATSRTWMFSRGIIPLGSLSCKHTWFKGPASSFAENCSIVIDLRHIQHTIQDQQFQTIKGGLQERRSHLQSTECQSTDWDLSGWSRSSHPHSTECQSTDWDLSGWFRHATFEPAHIDLRVGFVFLQQFSQWVYLNYLVDWLILQCLTSPPTQYRLYGRQFYRSKDPTNSIKVLKVGKLQK